MNDKAALNLSGGKPSNITNPPTNTNGGITPPRKMPRISEPSLPSDMNSYMDYMKGNNNNTADSSDGEKQPSSNFNKVRQFVVDGSGKGLNNSVGPNDKLSKKENPEPSKIG